MGRDVLPFDPDVWLDLFDKHGFRGMMDPKVLNPPFTKKQVARYTMIALQQSGRLRFRGVVVPSPALEKRIYDLHVRLNIAEELFASRLEEDRERERWQSEWKEWLAIDAEERRLERQKEEDAYNEFRKEFAADLAAFAKDDHPRLLLAQIAQYYPTLKRRALNWRIQARSLWRRRECWRRRERGETFVAIGKRLKITRGLAAIHYRRFMKKDIPREMRLRRQLEQGLRPLWLSENRRGDWLSQWDRHVKAKTRPIELDDPRDRGVWHEWQVDDIGNARTRTRL